MGMDYVDAAVVARIKASPLQLTLVYPPALPTAAGVSPGTAPLSPLTGEPDALEVVLTDAAPVSASETINCLWLDIATGGELTDRLSNEAIRYRSLGWISEATAVARVLVSDVALDSTNPYTGTKFDKVERVEHFNQRYRVLQVVPFGSGSKVPVTYHVWLVGNK